VAIRLSIARAIGGCRTKGQGCSVLTTRSVYRKEGVVCCALRTRLESSPIDSQYCCMGTSLADLKVILGLREENFLPATFSGAESGAQQLSNDVLRDPDILAAYARAFGVTRRTFGMAPPRNSGPGVELLPATAPFAKAFWDWLGCPYVAIDYDRS